MVVATIVKNTYGVSHRPNLAICFNTRPESADSYVPTVRHDVLHQRLGFEEQLRPADHADNGVIRWHAYIGRRNLPHLRKEAA